MNKLNWCEKYRLALNESLTVKDIMMLRDCGQPRATRIRDDAIKYCAVHDIEIESRKTPTSVVFIITKLDLDYYYQKMIQESKTINYSEVKESGSL